jgi:protein TonB
LVKASYAYCPKPDYPESGRREGWEGTVTLRVLVDERGESKSLEINRSSGFPALDQAAADNVKQRCRFNPARDGEKPIESWIRIPVVFRLADLKDR